MSDTNKNRYYGKLVCAFLLGCIVTLALVPYPSKPSIEQPRPDRDNKSDLIRYYELVCKTRGLVLNQRNVDTWCMDPKTKAIYEIEE